MREITWADAHIEHFRPQKFKNSNGELIYSNLDMEYTNLFASCNGSVPFEQKQDNCGHKKSMWFDEFLTISPLEENVETFFAYTLQGDVKSATDNIRANETILHLNLNSFGLTRARKTVIYLAIQNYDFDTVSDAVNFYSTPRNNALPQYCSAILYLLERGQIY